MPVRIAAAADAQRFASLAYAFCRDHLNPYVNFHRPCLQFDAQAGDLSDNEPAQRLDRARAILFEIIFNRSKTAA